MKCKYCDFENNPKEKICQYCGSYLKTPSYIYHIIIAIGISLIYEYIQYIISVKYKFLFLCLSAVIGLIGCVQLFIEIIKIKKIRYKNNIDINKILNLYFQKIAFEKGIIVNFIKAEGSEVKLINNETAILTLDNENINITQNSTILSIPTSSIKKIDFYNEGKNIFFKICDNNDAEYTFQERDKDYKYLFSLEEKFGIKINNSLNIK